MRIDAANGKGGPSYRAAVAHVLSSGRASAATLERLMGIGREDAVALIERMEAEGIVSPADPFGLRKLMPGAAAVREGWADEAPSPPMFAEPDDEGDLAIFGRLSNDGDIVAARERDIAEAVERMIAKVERQRGRFDEQAREAIRQIVERALILMERRDAINADIRMLFGFAKEVGFNPRGLRAAIADLRMDQDVREEREAQHAAYRAVLGIDGPKIDIVIEKPSAPVPAAGKKISAREKTFRDSMALIAASRIADAS